MKKNANVIYVASRYTVLVNSLLRVNEETNETQKETRSRRKEALPRAADCPHLQVMTSNTLFVDKCDFGSCLTDNVMVAPTVTRQEPFSHFPTSSLRIALPDVFTWFRNVPACIRNVPSSVATRTSFPSRTPPFRVLCWIPHLIFFLSNVTSKIRVSTTYVRYGFRFGLSFHA